MAPFGGRPAVGQATGHLRRSALALSAAILLGVLALNVATAAASTTPFDTSTGFVSAGGYTSATLGGTVSSKAEAATYCVFEYGPTSSYGSTVPCAEATPQPFN